MTQETKGFLKILKNECVKGKRLIPIPHDYAMDLLLHIAELETEIKELNDSITWRTNRYNALNKEYKLLKDRNEINIDRNIEAYRIVEQLENNRDKAIEYIEKHTDKIKKIVIPKIDFNYKKLLDILKGDSDG